MDNLIDWFYGQVVGFLGNFFAAMGNMGVELFELEWVQAVVRFFSQLGWAMYGISLVVCAFELASNIPQVVPTSSRRRSTPSRDFWPQACSRSCRSGSMRWPSPFREPSARG